MPKIGMEPYRREALISATIETLGDQGSLDVRVADIARKAGVSSGLAHHYFGSKERLLDATMHHLLVLLGTASGASQRISKTPEQRLQAILETNFSPRQFEPSTIATWLIFYVRAISHPEARRLLRIYIRRLNSNLTYALRQKTDADNARRIARGAAALIDGLWLRAALKHETFDADTSIETVRRYIASELQMSLWGSE